MKPDLQNHVIRIQYFSIMLNKNIMKFYYKLLTLSFILVLVSCDDFLDRPPLTSMNDDNAWTSEENLRLYANKYYTSFFPGYGSGFTYSVAAYMEIGRAHV